MGRSQLYRIPGRGKSMCKGPEVGKVFMCAFSKEASAVQQREGKEDQEVAEARPKGSVQPHSLPIAFLKVLS